MVLLTINSDTKKHLGASHRAFTVSSSIDDDQVRTFGGLYLDIFTGGHVNIGEYTQDPVSGKFN